MLKVRPDTTVTLIKSGGGVFEVTVDGALRYSKKATGAFPAEDDVRAMIA